MTEVQLLEQRILDDVKAKTGFSFVHLGGIPTTEKAVADVVLPVLAKWVKTLGAQNLRHAIYACFGTPHAYGYLEQLVEWWKTETYDLAVDCLTQNLSTLARPTDAELIWKLSVNLPLKHGKYILWSRLASFPSVGRQVKDRLVADLEDPNLQLGAVQRISTVDDPRIRKWFAARVDSPNPKLRNIARRVVARGKKLPRGVFFSDTPPDRTDEMFSTEVDLAALPSIVKQWERDLTVKLPAAVRSGRFALGVSPGQWILVPALDREGVTRQFWFRLEDVDVVEFVVTKEAQARTA